MAPLTDERCSYNSMIKYVTIRELKGWYEFIGEQTITDAILDRVVHNAHRIKLKSESLKKIMKK